jgi:uncharacterized protein (DUF433 family)
MATLDWSQCPAVESVPGRLGGAWVFRDTRLPVSAVFENLEAGASIDEIIEQFDVTREQINAVLEVPLDFAMAGLEIAPRKDCRCRQLSDGRQLYRGGVAGIAPRSTLRPESLVRGT